MNKKMCFVIKNINLLRAEWNKIHRDKVKTDDDKCMDQFGDVEI